MYKKNIVSIYNHGYLSGHHDTVEGVFTDIERKDMQDVHEEEVEEIIDDLENRSSDYILPPKMIKVLIRDIAPFIHYKGDPLYRSVEIELTDEQRSKIKLRLVSGKPEVYEEVYKMFFGKENE